MPVRSAARRRASTTSSSNADFPYPTVTLSDGRTVKVDQAAYGDLRALPNRADREKVMSAFFKALGAFSRTFGTTMNGEVQKVQFFVEGAEVSSRRSRRALDGPNIPASVYTRLVDGVNKNLPTFHRYLKLRKRMMGVDELHYYDLYAPLVGSVDLKYTPEEAQKHVLAAVAPLGADYRRDHPARVQRALDRSLSERRQALGRLLERRRLRRPPVHADQLQRQVRRRQHAGARARATRCRATSRTRRSRIRSPNYPIFVAEVASTFNESLLIDYMLKNIKDDDTRLSLLGNYLENIKGTVFRQTQFAEFELRMHEMAQKGQPITGDALAKLYMDITKRYYGHDQGVCIVDDYIAHEWSYIPHFYRDFYVFQYATSFTASEALAAEGEGRRRRRRRKRYLAFLAPAARSIRSIC